MCGMPLTDAQLRELFERCDVDGSGTIDRAEFAAFFRQLEHFGAESEKEGSGDAAAVPPRIGDRVEVHQAAAEQHNGRNGVVVGAQGDRLRVDFGSAQLVLRKHNLRRIGAGPPPTDPAEHRAGWPGRATRADKVLKEHRVFDDGRMTFDEFSMVILHLTAR